MSQTTKNGQTPRGPGQNQVRSAANQCTCPNCNAKGDIFVEVNPIVRNVVEFCEFPHRCKRGVVDSEVRWMTINEL